MKFVLLGKIYGKDRTRFARRGAFVSTYNTQQTKDYEQLIQLACLRDCKDVLNKEYSGAIKMVIWAYFEPAKSISKKKYKELIGKPHLIKKDADNIAKCVADALNKIAYKDDSQICELIVHKQYAEVERLEVEILEV